jgi:hypothetical protein
LGFVTRLHDTTPTPRAPPNKITEELRTAPPKKSQEQNMRETLVPLSEGTSHLNSFDAFKPAPINPKQI